MNQSTENASPRPHRGIDLIAAAFTTVVAMWIVGYVTHMPLIQAPGSVVFVLLILTLAAGGWLMGRYGRRGLRGAFGLGLLIALVNLLVLGSLLADLQRGPSPLLWLPGYFLATCIVVFIGWVLGLRHYVERDFHWPTLMGIATVAATGLVITAGGLVTGFDAGFAVPDWPNTFGSNMFLFPLSRMTGGIYYEHAHRMAGALVGLTAMTLMIWLWTTDRPGYVKWLATGAFVLVCIQGVAGGVWVTRVDPTDAKAMAGAVELADGTFIARPTLAYVLFHGTMGQLLLGVFAALAAMLSRTWRRTDLTITHPAAATDRVLGILLLLALAVQLILGVYVRKAGGGTSVLMHISFAFVVAVLAVGASVRAESLWGDRLRVMRLTGIALGVAVVAQLCLGFLALIFRDAPTASTVTVGSDAVSSAGDAIFTTLHQSNGAALLALAALLATWNFRLLQPPAMPAKQPPPAPEDADADASDPHQDQGTKSPSREESLA